MWKAHKCTLFTIWHYRMEVKGVSIYFGYVFITFFFFYFLWREERRKNCHNSMNHFLFLWMRIEMIAMGARCSFPFIRVWSRNIRFAKYSNFFQQTHTHTHKCLCYCSANASIYTNNGVFFFFAIEINLN